MVGQVDLEKVFNEYSGTKDFNEGIGEVQENLQNAQKEGDQQKIKEIQQDFQTKRSQLVETFYSEVEKASPRISEKMDVELIVAEVLYKTDKADVADVSDELIKEMN